ncbi:MAG: HlyD family type I secretion periplasmic adaptor subunit [Magnetococcales bacterium]|nr:HlyD family type I secretion periplasmic adaptor subunit [Magnetococcales bacterium]
MKLFATTPDPLHIRPIEAMGDLRDAGGDLLIRNTWKIILLVFLPVLLWSTLARLEEVSHVQGQVLPSGSVQVVQHLEGGIVAEILVSESQLVEQGDIMFRLDRNQSLPEQEQMELKIASLQASAIRLRAFAAGKEPDFAELLPRFATIVAAQKENHQRQTQSLKSNLAVLDAQIAQRRLDLKQVKDALGIARQQDTVTADMLKIRQDLVDRQAISKVIYLETKRAHLAAQGEVERLQKQMANIQGALTETEQRRSKLTTDTRQQASNELAVSMNELSQIRDSLTRISDQVVRLDVRSPVRGLVQELRVQTPGVVVPPGGTLAEIVPVNDHLQIEVRIPPQDVGRITKDQAVLVKLSSYEFSRFGTLDGHLVNISPSTLSQEGSQPYFKGVITLEKNFVGDIPGVHRILPGMLAQVDITLGARSVLATLLHPMSTAVQEAFKER